MEHFFDTREEASAAAADRIATALQHRLDHQKAATLVVSGGTSPVQCFELLAHMDLCWSRIGVLPSDDRWVPGEHDDSNERLVRDNLLVNGAASADLLPFYTDETSVEERAAILDQEIRFVPFPFACSLLGMGTDGHFASLFPDAENLDEGLDLDSEILCLPVRTEASPYPRITLTQSALSRSDEIVLLFFGDEKRKVYEKAKAGNARYPVTRLLRQKRAPVHCYWAP
jgi:6-phosphogluconolactonase